MQRKMSLWLAVVALLLSACAPKAVAPPPLLPPVETELNSARVLRGDVEKVEQYAGKLVNEAVGLYYPDTDMVFEGYTVNMGSVVKAGDVVARLDGTETRKKIARKQRELDNLEALFALRKVAMRSQVDILQEELRQQEIQGHYEEDYLQARGNIEDMINEFDFAVQEHEIRKSQLGAEIEKLRNHLSEAALISTVDGVVVWIEAVENGAYVTPYEPILYIANPAVFLAEIIEDRSASILGGVEVNLLYKGERYPLAYIQPEITKLLELQKENRKHHPRFSFPEGAPQGLRVGTYVMIETCYGRAEDALYIPAEALYRDESGSFVYRLDSGAKVRTPIKIGISTGIYVEVTEGLQEGDEVLVRS